MPIASVRTAATVKPGRFHSVRAAYRRSCQRSLSNRPPGAPGVIAEGGCACRRGAMYSARTLPSLKSASATRVASSGDAPPAINSRQRSSRCCESSSTISASRIGESCRDARRGRTCGAQSGMLISRDPAYRLDERRPGLSLLREHPTSFSRHLVETAAPLVGLLDPGALDPVPLLELIEQRVERVDVELQVSAGSRFNQPAQVV